MRITDQAIDQACSDLKRTCGGVRNDYFGLLYIEQAHRVSREQATSQVAFSNNDYGIDGYHFDRELRNFYLFQFKYSDSYQQFKESFHRLIDDGMQRLFGAEDQDSKQNLILQQIKATLLENQAAIDRFYVHFIFTGDPQSAEQSRVLDDLRETLENKKFIIERFLGRQITLAVEFKSARSGRVGGTSHVHATRVYPLHLSDAITRDGPGDEHMLVAFVRLADLHAMFIDMGQRFFERNIRGALPPEGSVNRALKATFKRIIFDENESPQVFAFNHNGVTLAAEAVDRIDGEYRIAAPRLLNGAQTVTTFARFLKENEGNPRLIERRSMVDQLHVLCRIITRSDPDFVTTVTISNNRQNPVEPWSLRANDRIQLELADKFRDEVGLYYERQENAFRNLSDEDLEEMEVTGHKAIELYYLAQTFAVSDGEIDKLSRMVDVFEDDRLYGQLFSVARLKADARKIVLCYKVRFRVGRVLRAIEELGRNRYEFVKRGRNMLWALLCQAMLNDPELNEYAEEWGRSLTVEANFTDWILKLATTRCRFILFDLVEDKLYKPKAEEGNYSFLKNAAAFKKAMTIAYKRYKWTQRTLV